MRGEREQFLEMGVRLEIQTKELGMIVKNQQKAKSQVSPTKKAAP